jgi:hypothetical protein
MPGNAGDKKADGFREAFLAEIGEIAKRRARLETESNTGGDFDAAAKRHREKLEAAVCGNNGEHGGAGDEFEPCIGDLAGLCLSGGGIRSAAFSIGALQALDSLKIRRKGENKARSLFEQMDYLSTVSGGGYAGCAVSVAMMNHRERFPFPSTMTKDEPPILQHIRDHSNYLFPEGGLPEKLKNLAAYLRGVFSHVPVLAVAILAPALITIFVKRSLGELDKPTRLLGERVREYPDAFFLVTAALLFATGFGLVIWGAWRSHIAGGAREYKTKGTKFAAIAIAVLALAGFLQLQPRLISELRRQSCESTFIEFRDKPEFVGPVPYFECDIDWIGDLNVREAEYQRLRKAAIDHGEPMPERPPNGLAGKFFAAIQKLSISLTAVAAFVAAAKGFVGFGETGDSGRTGWWALLAARSRQIVYLLIGLALPLAMWVAYLYLSFWGLSDTVGKYSHAPQWLVGLARSIPGTTDPGPSLVYFLLAFACVILTLLMDANANSPHNLYRDRLAAAFQRGPGSPQDGTPESDGRAGLKLSGIGNGAAPFHLINAAVNLQASRQTNKRGRNAGFFTFSKSHVGSDETKYLETAKIEEIEAGFRLSSAMAVSAAAASTAMGSMTMRPLALTLAALNVRLGYWFANPGLAAGFFGDGISSMPAKNNPNSTVASQFREKVAKIIKSYGRNDKAISNFHSLFFLQNNPFGYLLKEVSGQLHERGPLVYLTDGGHIENLGLYTLLKRRCKLIIVIDAEADPEMNFGSFVTAQRYARIDLGTRIDLPLARLSKGALDTRAELDPPTKGTAPGAAQMINIAERPHAAIGVIEYPEQQTGVIVYIKSSMTSDENDYICDYARRHRSFPHETTGDQFFSEEQFEAYRALGFHATHGAFSGSALVETNGKTASAAPKHKDAAKTTPFEAGIMREEISSRSVALIDTPDFDGAAIEAFFALFEGPQIGPGDIKQKSVARSPAFTR